MCVFIRLRMLSRLYQFCTQTNGFRRKDHFDQNTVDVINNCFYVDYCLASSPFVAEAKRLLKEVSELLMKESFKITKWVSNSREVIKTMPKSDRSTKLQSLGLCSANFPKERALGL